MRDDETIQDFHMSILDIANSSSALGENMSEEKLVRKILRSLPKKFDMKVTAIEEAQDIKDMKVDELMGSLQTFEIALDERTDKKSKSIAFVSNSAESNMEDSDNLAEEVGLLGRQLNRVMKRFEGRYRPNVKNMLPSMNKNSELQKREEAEDKSDYLK